MCLTQQKGTQMDTYLKLLRIDEVAERTTLGKSTIWLKISEAKFPPPIRLSPGIVVWKQSEIEDWIESHVSKSRGADDA